MIVGALIDGQNYTVKDLFSHAENRQRRYEEAMRLSRKYSQPSEEGQATAKSEEIKDEVILSSEAQDLIKSRPNNETEVAPEDQSAQEPSFSSVWSMTAKDGTRIHIEAAKSSDPDNTEYQAARITFTDPAGNSYSEIISDSAVICRNEDGSWRIQHNAAGGPLQGTDGDDLIVALPGSAPAEYVEINAGDGDNVVLDLTSGHTKITTGTGNDTIIGLGGGSYDVTSGAGDDNIYLKGGYAKVDAGDGNDKIHILDAISVDLDAGNGDDSIVIDGDELYKATIKGGGGDDSIVFNTWVNESTIDGGGGHDSLTFNAAAKGNTVGASVRSSLISGGDGDDSITINGSVSYSTVEGGAGNDAITANSAKHSKISGGDGDDIINFVFASGAIVDGGAGNDSINIGATFEPSVIRGGDGNDTIDIGTILLRGSEIYGDDGDDSIFVEKVNSGSMDDFFRAGTRTAYQVGVRTFYVDENTPNTIISGGAGNDVITAEKISNTDVLGGNGDDIINIGTMSSSIVIGGSGDDQITFGEASNSAIDGGEGQDTIIGQTVISSGLAGGVGPDDINIAGSFDSEIAGDSLNWDRWSAMKKYMANESLEPGAALKGDESPLKDENDSEAGGAGNGNDTPDHYASAGKSMDSTGRVLSDQEIFIDALMRGDRTHPRVKEILERREKSNFSFRV